MATFISSLRPSARRGSFKITPIMLNSLIVLVLIGGMAKPFATVQRAAAFDDPMCFDGYVYDEMTGDCVAESEHWIDESSEEPDPPDNIQTIPPPDEVEELEAHEVHDPYTASVSIQKLFCPETLDNITVYSYGELFGACQESGPAVSFSVTDVGGVSQTATTTGQPGSVNFAMLPGGRVAVQEAVPTGYSAGIAYCAFSDEYGAPLGTYVVTPQNGYAEFDLPIAGLIDCDWFNVNEGMGAEETVSITITKHLCPTGLRFIAAPTVDDLLQACADLGDGVTFSLFEDLTAATFTGVTGADGKVVFDGLAGAAYIITEQPNPGMTSLTVFCRPVTAGVPGGYEELGSGTAVSYQIPDGASAECIWFNEVEKRDIEVIKWDCGDAVWRQFAEYHYAFADAASFPFPLDYDQLRELCVTPMDGVTFSLTPSGGETVAAITGDSGASGVARWDASAYQPGAFVITESIPHGYLNPVVFCGSSQVGQERAQLAASDGAVTVELQHGDQGIICDVFNLPTPEGWLTVFKYWCPSHVDLDAPGLTVEDFMTACPRDGDRVAEFTLHQDRYTDAEARQTTNHLGEAFFGGLHLEPILLRENLREDFSVPYLACDSGPLSGGDPSATSAEVVSFQPMVRGEGWVPLSHEYPAITCHVFNTSYANYLTVIKYVCDDHHHRTGWTLDDYRQHCPDHLEGVEFVLDGPDGSSQRQRIENGATVFSFVGGGEYALTEIIPDGYGVPAVFCYGNDGAETPINISQRNERFTFEADRDVIICSVYNVRHEHHEGYLTVEKRTCPDESHFMADRGYEFIELLQMCERLTNGIGFHLGPVGLPATQSKITGMSGTGLVSFSGVQAGTKYWLREDVPINTFSVLVHCAVGMDGTSLDFTLVDQGTIELTIPSGAHVRCFYFNIPTRKPIPQPSPVMPKPSPTTVNPPRPSPPPVVQPPTGPKPGPSAPVKPGPTTKLPNTGSGLTINAADPMRSQLYLMLTAAAVLMMIASVIGLTLPVRSGRGRDQSERRR